MAEPDLRPAPVPPKLYGGQYLAMVRSGLEAIRREELPRFGQAAAWIAERRAARASAAFAICRAISRPARREPGRRILRQYRAGLPCGAEPDAGPARSPPRRCFAAAGLPGERRRHGGGRPRPARGTVFITSGGPGPDQAREPRHLYVNPHWPRSDAGLVLEGYDVKACPLSAVLGLPCYYAICEEVEGHE